VGLPGKHLPTPNPSPGLCLPGTFEQLGAMCEWGPCGLGPPGHLWALLGARWGRPRLPQVVQWTAPCPWWQPEALCPVGAVPARWVSLADRSGPCGSPHTCRRRALGISCLPKWAVEVGTQGPGPAGPGPAGPGRGTPRTGTPSGTPLGTGSPLRRCSPFGGASPDPCPPSSLILFYFLGAWIPPALTPPTPLGHLFITVSACMVP
jgi:hypothetical protein